MSKKVSVITILATCLVLMLGVAPAAYAKVYSFDEMKAYYPTHRNYVENYNIDPDSLSLSNLDGVYLGDDGVIGSADDGTHEYDGDTIDLFKVMIKMPVANNIVACGYVQAPVQATESELNKT